MSCHWLFVLVVVVVWLASYSFVAFAVKYYGKEKRCGERLPVKTDQDALREGYRYVNFICYLFSIHFCNAFHSGSGLWFCQSLQGRISEMLIVILSVADFVYYMFLEPSDFTSDTRVGIDNTSLLSEFTICTDVFAMILGGSAIPISFFNIHPFSSFHPFFPLVTEEEVNCVPSI